MTSKEEYGVLRFIEHNQICHISSDVIDGRPLMEWVKFHPRIEKELCFEWIQSIVKQLSLFHRSKNTVCYQYVNPYGLIISRDSRLHILDPGASQNEEILKKMRRKVIREHFLPSEAQYYQNPGEELDIYGLGRTIQYLLSSVELEPELSKSEEIKLQKVIIKCLNRQSKKSFQNISEIQKFIPKTKQSDKKRKIPVIKIGICTVISVAAVWVGNRAYLQGSADSTDAITGDEEKKVQERTEETSQSKEERILCEELGLLYFLEFDDYEKSSDYFGRIEGDELAAEMEKLSEILLSNHISQNELRTVLEKIESNLPENSEEYYECLFEAYRWLESEEDKENQLRIGAICLENADEKREKETKKQMAVIYEEKGENEDAVQLYSQLLSVEEEEGEREELFKKIASLLDELEKKDEALQILREGIQEHTDSVELRVQYIRMQYKDTSIERVTLIELINEQVGKCKLLAESEEFQKMLKEYGMQVKGGKVCEKE
ncbi:MAG: tetratricopeptide repeat protein [Dorea sp.]